MVFGSNPSGHTLKAFHVNEELFCFLVGFDLMMVGILLFYHKLQTHGYGGTNQ